VGEVWGDLVLQTKFFLPEKVSTTTVSESLRYLAGSTLTQIELQRLTWRLAGNLVRLQRQQYVLPWLGQPYPEWVPAQICKVTPYRRSKQAGHEIQFRVLGGLCCPAVIPVWWSFRQQRFYAYYRDSQDRRGFGFSLIRHEQVTGYPFVDARQLMLLRCLLLIHPDKSTEELPGFSQMDFTTSLREWNMELQRQRARRTAKYTCPKDFPSTWPCHRCYVGLDQCTKAVHEKTYVLRKCDECQVDQAPFVDDQAKLCINCSVKAQVKHH
jgi:hypothetical protein